MAAAQARARSLGVTLALLAALAPAARGAVTSEPVDLLSAAVVAPERLDAVEGRLTLAYHGPQTGDFRVDRTIVFRFAKPFRLLVRDETGGLEVALDPERAQLYEPDRKQLVEVETAAVMGSGWAATLVDGLAFTTLYDPDRLGEVRRTFTMDLHRALAPPPDRHAASWAPSRPTGPTAGRLEPGDWLVVTPTEGSLYAAFLGLGRLALKIGPELGIPRELRYWARTRAGFRLSLVVAIPELQFNRRRPLEDYRCSAGPDARKTTGADVLMALAADRVAALWVRLRAAAERLLEALPALGGR